MSEKWGATHCPWCEKPLAMENEARTSDDLADRYGPKSLQVQGFEAGLCWSSWTGPDECDVLQGDDWDKAEQHLSAVLDERDALRARIAELEAGYETIAHILRHTEASTVAVIRIGETVKRMIPPASEAQP